MINFYLMKSLEHKRKAEISLYFLKIPKSKTLEQLQQIEFKSNQPERSKREDLSISNNWICFFCKKAERINPKCYWNCK